MKNTNPEIQLLTTSIADWLGVKLKPEPVRKPLTAEELKSLKPPRFVQVGWGLVRVD